MEKSNFIKARDAKEVIKKYDNELSEKFIDNKYCIVCKQNAIKPLDELPKVMKQDEGPWNGGTVANISFGYGSNHDMSSFFIAICDKCIEEADNAGFAVSLRDLKKRVKTYEEEQLKTARKEMVLVEIIESESGWGAKVDEIKEFDTLELAKDFITEYNKKNNLSVTPDWYMYARLKE